MDKPIAPSEYCPDDAILKSLEPRSAENETSLGRRNSSPAGDVGSARHSAVCAIDFDDDVDG
jgi:hypothetical protein